MLDEDMNSACRMQIHNPAKFLAFFCFSFLMVSDLQC